MRSGARPSTTVSEVSPMRETALPSTKTVHAGAPEPRIHGAIATPIFQSAMYLYGGETAYDDLEYIRLNNTPNHDVLHAKLAALEGAEAALVTASGMAAISTALLTVAGAGDHLLLQRELYGGTHGLATVELPHLGIECDLVDGGDPSAWESKLRPTTKALYLESLSNPLLGVPDLEAAVAFARAHGLVSMVDNTFASPLGLRPAELGFDLSLHSCTKYLNGHSDIVAGAVIGRRDLVEAVRLRLNHLGGSLDPHACFLLERGLKTLAVRMARHEENAARVARFLEEHPAVARVRWPGLASHPGHERAARLFDGFGGMLSFELAGRAEAARRVLARLRLFLVAPSLGSVESLATLPSKTSHAGLAPEQRAALGITDGLVRLSVGIEAAEDLVADLEGALAEESA